MLIIRNLILISIQSWTYLKGKGNWKNFYYVYMYLYLHTNIHEWISNNNDDEDDNDGYDHKLFQLKLEDLHKNVPVAIYLPFKLVQSGSFLCLIFIFIYMYCHTLEQRKV